MSCVKYCVLKMPLVITAVQTHGGVSSALRRIHAPTRNEEGTYIRASVASDLDTLSTLRIAKSSMNGDEQIFVGWVGGTPESFLYLRLRWFLVLLCFTWSLCFSLSPCLFSVFLVNCVLLCFSVLILTALCLPYLFLVYLAFPHCLALILH